jgi:hypothetical protein
MTKTRPITFAEFRSFLQRLGYVEKRHPTARVFDHPKEGLLPFRRYRDDEAVDAQDLVYARRFLDLRGVIEADVFDATLLRAHTPA